MLTFCFGSNFRLAAKLQTQYRGFGVPLTLLPLLLTSHLIVVQGRLIQIHTRVPLAGRDTLPRGRGHSRKLLLQEGVNLPCPWGWGEGWCSGETDQLVQRFRGENIWSVGCSWRLGCERRCGDAPGRRTVSPRSTILSNLDLILDRGTPGGLSGHHPHPRACCLHSETERNKESGQVKMCQRGDTKNPLRSWVHRTRCMRWGHILAGAAMGLPDQCRSDPATLRALPVPLGPKPSPGLAPSSLRPPSPVNSTPTSSPRVARKQPCRLPPGIPEGSSGSTRQPWAIFPQK